MNILTIHGKVTASWAQTQELVSDKTFFTTITLTSWNSFFKYHPIQPFEMKDLPFSGKSAFQHKDETTQCLWLTYSSEKQAHFFFLC